MNKPGKLTRICLDNGKDERNLWLERDPHQCPLDYKSSILPTELSSPYLVAILVPSHLFAVGASAEATLYPNTQWN